jgi:RecA-family ATPase
MDGDADATAIISLIEDLEREHGEKVALVIGDTLARIAAGANENSGEDMAVVLKHADVIRSATGAAFLWIHHSGKDQAKGMRGWSGIRAAIDTEIEVTVDEATGVRTAEITKQRDLPGKGTRIGFRLETVHLGVNQWGTARTSCVVVPADAPPKREQGRRQSEVAGAIAELLTSHGAGMRKGEIVKHFEDRHHKASVYKELSKMAAAGRIYEVAGVIALLNGGKVKV